MKNAEYVEAHCLLPSDRRHVWATVRAATPAGLWRKLGGDASLTRCYRIIGGKRTRFDLAREVAR